MPSQPIITDGGVGRPLVRQGCCRSTLCVCASVCVCVCVPWGFFFPPLWSGKVPARLLTGDGCGEAPPLIFAQVAEASSNEKWSR